MKLDDAALQQLVQTLREEAAEQIDRIGTAVDAIERGASDADRSTLIDEAYRQAHNLKGAAVSLGFNLTSRLVHAIESALTALRKTEGKAAADEVATIDAVQRALGVVSVTLAADPSAEIGTSVDETIGQLEKAAQAPAPAGFRVSIPAGPAASRETGTAVARHPPPTTTQRPPADGSATAPGGPPPISAAPPDESLRVSTKKLGALMSQVGELLAARLRTDQRLAELSELLTDEEVRLGRRHALRTAFEEHAPPQLDPHARRLYDAMKEGLVHQGHLVARLRDLVRAFEADTLSSTILSGKLQEDIRRIQTFPLASVLDPLPRMVRRLARESTKQAEFDVEGADIELDKKVLDALRDPLNHLLRNAVDHGVDSPDARAGAGKAPTARISIVARHQGDSIVIAVRDDGPGIDLDAVRRTAVARGLLNAAEAATAPEPRLIEFLFAPGFTTREEATGLSGRGVGLDVVRANIEKLHGGVHIESRRGTGTTVTIVLPLTVYVVHALIARIGEQRFGLPISATQHILRVKPEDFIDIEQTETILVDGRPVAVVRLASLLGIDGKPAAHPDRFPVVVIGTGDSRYAVAVDEIVGDQMVLAKSLEPPLARVRNIAGATILGDGTVVLMLNPMDLLRAASAVGLAARAFQPTGRTRPRTRVLLCDDSFTTRALERSVLELAGFEVTACADGAQAVAALETGRFDVVVTDVSMPGMSGLDLCARIRADSRYKALPVILVTSLGSDEDRRRGLETGADAYIVKSEFDHEKLVLTVNQLAARS